MLVPRTGFEPVISTLKGFRAKFSELDPLQIRIGPGTRSFNLKIGGGLIVTVRPIYLLVLTCWRLSRYACNQARVVTQARPTFSARRRPFDAWFFKVDGDRSAILAASAILRRYSWR